MQALREEDEEKARSVAATKKVIDELKLLYKQKLMPVEQAFLFNRFYSPLMTDAEFDAKPMVLLIGQYSTGKTTFIRYLLGRNFPNQRIGPEPTTDRFVAVVGGEEDRILPGNALCVSPELPFRGLEKFGTGFLNHFEGAQCDSKVLEQITLCDTPGILAGRKQGERGYDYKEICAWFAERSDLILLLFDAHKLDISDEFTQTVEKLKGHEDKIRCILNKADQIDRQRLMRVYGALMWGMGKVLRTPEVLRVYIGSFWEEPLMHEELANLFESEENDLIQDIRDLPRNSAVRKINELVKRARLAKVNAHIITHLKNQMPMMMGAKKKQDALIADMAGVFRTVMKQDALSPGDFPELNEFKKKLDEEDFSKFPKLTKKQLDGIEELLSSDIPRLMSDLPKQHFDRSNEIPTNQDPGNQSGSYDSQMYGSQGGGGAKRTMGGGTSGGVMGGNSLIRPAAAAAEPSLPQPPMQQQQYQQQQYQQQQYQPPPSVEVAPVAVVQAAPVTSPKPNPFAKPAAPKPNPFAKPVQVDWPVYEFKANYDAQFQSCGPVDGKVSGDSARSVLMELETDMDKLFAIWELSDYDGDGELSEEEFALALYLCKIASEGQPIPPALPPNLIPPSAR